MPPRPRKKEGHKIWVFGLASMALLLISASYFLFSSLLPLFIAFGLAYAFHPLVELAEARGIPRSLGAALLILVLCAAALLTLNFVVPVLLQESREFFETFPGQVTVVAGKLARFGNSQGMNLPVQQELADSLGAWTHKIFSSALASGFGSGGQIYTSLSGIMEFGVNLVIVPVFFFYLLRDLPLIKRHWLDLVPLRHQSAVLSGLRKIDGVFSSYIRGQLTVALILATVFSICLTLMGVRYGLVIGIASGFLNLVPYLGQAVGALLSLLMVMVDFRGWGRVLAVPLLFSTVNFIEGTFITPRIVGGKVGLSSLQTMVALVLGADLAGLAGMLVAIPIAASFKVLYLDLNQEYKRSKFYSAVTAEK